MYDCNSGMRSIFEGSPHLLRRGRSVRTIIARPEVSEPLVEGDSPVDARGVSIYGSVIRDGGVFRMWYQAWPEKSGGGNTVAVGYAESDDGLNWRKPKLGLVEFNGSVANNLVNLAVHCPSVFIDPTAPASHRYRATGFSTPKYSLNGKPVAVASRGYHTAHSADGLNWEFDSAEPRWPEADVITSCWDEYRDCGYVALKNIIVTGGMRRRCIANAVLRDGEYSDARLALIPDDYDDIKARDSGSVAADYYGMGWVPRPDMTCGLLWNFRIDEPLSNMEPENFKPQGLYGQVDLSVVWRPGADDIWRHLPGRPTFLAAGDPGTWYSGNIYTASQTVRVGDEDWMYFSGAAVRHGDYHTVNWKPDEARLKIAAEAGLFRIGVMRWKAGQLFGLHAPLYDEIDLALPEDSAGKELRLNMRAWEKGSVRAELLWRDDYKVVENYSRDDCTGVSNDRTDGVVEWKSGSTLPAISSEQLILRLCLTRAAVYGFDVKAKD